MVPPRCIAWAEIDACYKRTQQTTIIPENRVLLDHRSVCSSRSEKPLDCLLLVREKNGKLIHHFSKQQQCMVSFRPLFLVSRRPHWGPPKKEASHLHIRIQTYKKNAIRLIGPDREHVHCANKGSMKKKKIQSVVVKKEKEKKVEKTCSVVAQSVNPSRHLSAGQVYVPLSHPRK